LLIDRCCRDLLRQRHGPRDRLIGKQPAPGAGSGDRGRLAWRCARKRSIPLWRIVSRGRPFRGSPRPDHHAPPAARVNARPARAAPPGFASGHCRTIFVLRGRSLELLYVILPTPGTGVPCESADGREEHGNEAFPDSRRLIGLILLTATGTNSPMASPPFAQPFEGTQPGRAAARGPADIQVTSVSAENRRALSETAAATSSSHPG